MISNRKPEHPHTKNCPNAGVRDVDTDGSFLDLADQENGRVRPAGLRRDARCQR
jgi:hypothetical protein